MARPKKESAESRNNRIAARLTEEEREAAEQLKKKLHLTNDSDVVTLFLRAIQGKTIGELRAFLYPDDKEEILRLLAA